jgi:hypothetical protein
MGRTSRNGSLTCQNDMHSPAENYTRHVSEYEGAT